MGHEELWDNIARRVFILTQRANVFSNLIDELDKRVARLESLQCTEEEIDKLMGRVSTDDAGRRDEVLSGT
jgi:hypothetical protein